MADNRSLELQNGIGTTSSAHLDAKYNVFDDTERDALITNNQVEIGMKIYHQTDGLIYWLKEYPTTSSLTGVTWEELGKAFDQELNTTDSPTFDDLEITGTFIFGSDTISLPTESGTLALLSDAPVSGTDFDPVGTDNSTNVTLSGSYDYLTLSGQEITLGQIDATTDILGLSIVATSGSYDDLDDIPTNFAYTGIDNSFTTTQTFNGNLILVNGDYSSTLDQGTLESDITISFPIESGSLSLEQSVGTSDDIDNGWTTVQSANVNTVFNSNDFTVTYNSTQGATYIEATAQTTLLSDSFYYDDSSTLYPNISTYRQTEMFFTGNSQTFTLAFEPTFIRGIFISGNDGSVYLDDDDYTYNTPNQLIIIPTLTDGSKIRIIYDHFIEEPTEVLV